VNPLLFLPLLIACDSGDGDTATEPTSGATSVTTTGGSTGGATSGGTTGGSTGTSGGTTTDLSLPNGTFLMTTALESVGGIHVPFQAELRSVQTPDGPAIASFSLAATDGADSVSDVLVTMTDIPIDADLGFLAQTGVFPLPAEFSPTSSEVEIDGGFDGTVQSAEAFCGEMSGQVVTFELDLAGSTFAAVPWDQRADSPPASCSGGGGDLTPIEVCPALVAGSNTGFLSGEIERSFEIVLPSAYIADQGWPVAIAFHGFGGTADGFLEEADLADMADAFGVILVAPQGADLGGTEGFDAFSDEGTNRDLRLFDDLLLCLPQSFSVDSERIYATGMSNGGLLTGMLTARRSDVLAATAPFSGGMGVDLPEDASAIPVLVTHGGPEDVSYEQDFYTLAGEMISTLTGNGSFVVECDHGLGHELEAEFWPWAFQFLMDHPQGVFPEPYTGGLPPEFPSFCQVVQ